MEDHVPRPDDPRGDRRDRGDRERELSPAAAAPAARGATARSVPAPYVEPGLRHLVARIDDGMVRGACGFVFACLLPLACVLFDRPISRAAGIMDYNGERLIAWPTWMSPLGALALPLLGWSILRGPRGDATSAALGGVSAVVSVAAATCWIAKLPESLMLVVCCGFGLLPIMCTWIAARHAWACLATAAATLGSTRTTRIALRGAALVIVPALLAGWALWSAEYRTASIIAGVTPGDRLAAIERLEFLYRLCPHMDFAGTYAAYCDAEALGVNPHQIDRAIMGFHGPFWSPR